jgi:hypothetical protein
MTPDVSVLTVPILAVKGAVVVPAETVTLAGVVIRVELEDRETTVLVDGGCDSVTVQVLVALDIRPVGLQTREERLTGAAVRLMVAVLDTPPRVAVRVAL